MTTNPANDNKRIISRKFAREHGMNIYFTGKPCKRNHISVRRVRDGQCIVCYKEYKTSPARRKIDAELQKKWKRENPQRFRQHRGKYYDKNAEKLKAKNRESYKKQDVRDRKLSMMKVRAAIKRRGHMKMVIENGWLVKSGRRWMPRDEEAIQLMAALVGLSVPPRPSHLKHQSAKLESSD